VGFNPVEIYFVVAARVSEDFSGCLESFGFYGSLLKCQERCFVATDEVYLGQML
jgi:hypothetical protein